MTSTGVSLEELAIQCHERFHTCRGEEPPVWNELERNPRIRWLESLEALGEFIAQEVDTRFSQLTQRFVKNYHGSAGVSREEMLAFEVCIRHVVNMVTAEDSEDVKEAIEFKWSQWYDAKLSSKEVQ